MLIQRQHPHEKLISSCRKIIDEVAKNRSDNLTKKDGEHLIICAAALAEDNVSIDYKQQFYYLIETAANNTTAQAVRIKYLALQLEFLEACPELLKLPNDENDSKGLNSFNR